MANKDNGVKGLTRIELSNNQTNKHFSGEKAYYLSCVFPILIDLWWSPIHLATLFFLLNFTYSKNASNVMSYVEGTDIFFIISKSLSSYLVTHPG